MTLEEAVRRLMARDSVLVAVDFDGTLAPIVDHPDHAAPDQRAMSALASIAARRGVEVAIVSGRSTLDLERKLGGSTGFTLVGEHGNDLGAEVTAHPLVAKAQAMVGALAEPMEGAMVEHKPSSVTLHYRNVEPGLVPELLGRVKDWAAGHQELSLLEGKDVIELSAGTRTKGDAVRDLANQGAGVIYIGDDITDETVFEVLGDADVAIKVGSGPTAAKFRVESVSDVVAILEMIALASR